MDPSIDNNNNNEWDINLDFSVYLISIIYSVYHTFVSGVLKDIDALLLFYKKKKLYLNGIW